MFDRLRMSIEGSARRTHDRRSVDDDRVDEQLRAHRQVHERELLRAHGVHTAEVSEQRLAPLVERPAEGGGLRGQRPGAERLHRLLSV